MLRGHQLATVDAKGRLKIPADFLALLRKHGDEFYVTSETGTFVKVYPLKVWEGIEARLEKLPSHNPTKQKFLALTSYYWHMTRVDAQGRILIPPVLRESAQMAGEVVVLGALDHLEVWNHARFQEQWVHGQRWTAEDARMLGEQLGI